MESQLKILMLEDSLIDAEIVQQLLLKEKPNSIFKLVMTEEDYLEALDQFQPDLILSDNTLPQFNATEALKLFNQRSLPIPFILVTGTVSEEFAADIIKMGADDYILKDRLARLPAAIDAALQKKKTEAAMKHSEEVRKLVMNASLDAIITIDSSGGIVSWNPQSEKLFGWKEEAVAGKQFIQTIFPKRYHGLHTKGFVDSVNEGSAIVLNKVNEITVHNNQHKEFPVDMIIVNIEQDKAHFYCAYIRDITERKKTEDKIRFNSDLLNTVGQAVIATDTNGFVIYWNNTAEKIYGWRIDEAIGKNIVDLVAGQQTKEQAIEIMEKLGRGNSWSGEFMVQRKDGSNFPAFVTDSPFYDQQGNLTGIIGVSIDITERKKAEETLKLMEEKIVKQKIEEQKKISRAIIKAQEQEKNYIGQELHDNINQILAGTKIFLGIAAKKSDTMREVLKYPMELIDSSIEEIRLLSHKQVTPLKNINLEELIRNLISNLNQNTIPKLTYNYAVSDKFLSDELKLNIYRVIQEQVNNILKHAGAKNIDISITTGDSNINIIVADDGKGFTVNTKRKGIGISNMINRVETFNGTIQIISSPGHGCKITATIPFQS